VLQTGTSVVSFDGAQQQVEFFQRVFSIVGFCFPHCVEIKQVGLLPPDGGTKLEFLRRDGLQ
jgi:hypothetical protein